MIRTVSFLLFFLYITTPLISSDSVKKNLIAGESITIKSNVLNETRKIFIYLPKGYRESAKKYPVLYVLDGYVHFLHVSGITDFLSFNGKTPGFIVAAVLNVDRNRDFLPTPSDKIPQAGGADRFLKFFKKELIPFIDKNYRTGEKRFLAGHSFGGVFSIYAMLKSPALFKGCFALSPALWWDNYLLFNLARKSFSKSKKRERFLYITMGNEGERMTAPAQKFAELLKLHAPDSLIWDYRFMKEENHGTIVHRSLYNGLLWLFKEWRFRGDISGKGIKILLEHQKKNRKRFGVSYDYSEQEINIAGYRLLNAKKYKLAEEAFLYNVKRFPFSANARDSLGEAYEKSGNLRKAVNNYELAVKLGKENKSPFLPAFIKNLKRCRKE